MLASSPTHHPRPAARRLPRSVSAPRRGVLVMLFMLALLVSMSGVWLQTLPPFADALPPAIGAPPPLDTSEPPALLAAARAALPGMVVTSTRREADWALLSMAAGGRSRGQARGAPIDGETALLLAARQADGSWALAAKGTPAFVSLLGQAPAWFIGPTVREQWLAEAAGQLQAEVNYRFPWPKGVVADLGKDSFGWHGTLDGLQGLDFFPTGGDWRIVAAASGSIVGICNGRDSVNVWVQHADGSIFVYGHLNKAGFDFDKLKEGQPVVQGQVLGVLRPGNFDFDGCGEAKQNSNSAHLHWDLSKGRSFLVDGWTIAYPTEYLQKGDLKLWKGSGFLSSNEVALGPASANQNLVRNGGFDAELTEWTRYGGLEWAPYNGALYFKRRPNSPEGASIYQDLNRSAEANAPFEVSAMLGNVSNVPKTVSVSIRPADSWDSYISCWFELPPNTPLQQHVMRGKTDRAWANIRYEVQVITADGIPDLVIDDISVTQRPDLTPMSTECQSERTTRPPQTECLQPLLRYWHAVRQTHFYTANWEELRLGRDGWRFERAEGYLSARQYCYTTQARPFYRLWDDQFQKHFYTIDPDERDYVVNDLSLRYRVEGIAGYALVAPDSALGAIALYRLYHPTFHDHFYTTSPGERDAAVGLGYTYERVAAGVFTVETLSRPTQAPVTPTPVVPTAPATFAPSGAQSGAPGSTFLLSGANFLGGSQVVIAVNGRVVGAITVNDENRFLVGVRFPAGAPAGAYTVTATEQAAGASLAAARSAQTQVTVTASGSVIADTGHAPVLLGTVTLYLPAVRQ